MIKTFENCSPEYQITIVWFFIFLTLLYMILVIYEGTGKRQRKTLLLDSVLLIVIFLITAVLCVWQRAFYEEDSMILFKIPYVILIVIGIGVFLYVGMKIFGIYKYRKSCLRENAVQESLDNLPSGIVFFDGNGMPKLMNRKMYQICQNLTGRDIQNITELEEALGHPLKENVFYDVDLKVYCFADGSVWKFSEKEIITTAGDHFFQVLASEVSELYRNKVLLKEENQKLQEMSVAMKELSKNVITLTREEEMLSMKMRVHDNLGYSVLAAQRMLMRESEADRDIFRSQWKQTLDLCGMEMSNLYFRLSYPMVEGSCGNIVTVLAPVDKKGNIYLDKAMFGDTKETYLSPSGTMTVKKGKYYNTYSTAFGNYIGRHELLGLKSCNGMPLAVLTLISEANYEKLTADNRRDWIIGTLLFLILLLVVFVGMSHRFVKPILRSLKALQEDTLTDENLSGISEVDALVDFMQKKRNTEKLENGGIPPNIEEMLKAFALRVETLTPSERMVLQYYVDGYTIQEIASLLYISIGTARKHNTNMNRKLGITVREELMLYIELFRKCNQLDKLTYSRTE